VLALFWLAVLLSYFVMHLDPVPKEITSVSDIYIVTLIAFSGIALYAAEALRTMDDLMRIIRTFIAAAALMSLIAIMQARLNFDVTDYIAKLPFFRRTGKMRAWSREEASDDRPPRRRTQSSSASSRGSRSRSRST
jgi:hypothetical protein